MTTPQPTYAFTTFIFLRTLSFVYLFAFWSIATQAIGLWGANGVSPIADYARRVSEVLGTARFLQMPTLFWFGSSDTWITGLALAGVVASLLALVGVAQGWMLLLCYLFYLSFVNSGRQFMSFQWDILLLEVGFLALFAAPWLRPFTFAQAIEAPWMVRWMFYLVLFKLMFLSGVVKLRSGDPAWRDLTALSYHYFTQPLPNPLSVLANAQPMWIQKIACGATFAIELILPFAIFPPLTRPWAALGFTALSFSILLTGNYAFFNWLTLALCVWLVPDSIWLTFFEKLNLAAPSLAVYRGDFFTSGFTYLVMTVLALLTFFWCSEWFLPAAVEETLAPLIEPLQPFRLSSAYGLFAVMTKTRPEIVIEGSLDGEEWREFEFRFKIGALKRRPPVIAPFQPRLDWQMWFAALGSSRQNPWLTDLLERLRANSPAVMDFFVNRPFGAEAPKFLRAHLYEYEMCLPGEIWRDGTWWRRHDLGLYR